MGSSQEEGLPCQPSQPDHDAGGHCGPDLEGTERASATPGPPGLLNSHPPADSDDTNATRPSAALLEGLLLGGGKPSPHSTRPGPFFYIGGSNGATIISSYCKSKGWQRIQDSRRDDYTLKWCEVKSRDNYGSFREGEQLLYQLPNNKLLTTKIGLLSTLRGRARAMSQASKVLGGAQARLEKDTAAPALEDLPWTSPGYLRPQRVLRMEEFFPETYRLDLKHEREAFFTLFDETQIWICKPTASNQGKGIFLLRNQEEVAALQAKTRSMEDDPIHHKTPFRGPQARVVQRYIQNPLLLDGRKFDVRSYLLIACTTPYMIFFGHGYARLTLSLYDPRSSDLSGHLTNQFMQKKSPLYMLLKEDTVWSMEHLNRYINDTFWKARGLPKDWVFTTLTPGPGSSSQGRSFLTHRRVSLWLGRRRSEEPPVTFLTSPKLSLNCDNSQNIKFTILKCAVQWLLVFQKLCNYHHQFQNISSPQKRNTTNEPSQLHCRPFLAAADGPSLSPVSFLLAWCFQGSST
ncbi:inactive polyglycylase TTLL10 isoform X11 [Pongo pygmaeus]|uniref:inactive polyglycylase TTLL10 isoform X11 n=1 Tax=Pongo pygmaeus TaxID=9600 RepID=UPI00300D5FB9